MASAVQAAHPPGRPASEPARAPTGTQVVTIAGQRVAFGLTWHPLEQPTELPTALRRAHRSGFRHVALLPDRSLIGLAPALPRGSKVQAAVLLLVERFCGGGVEVCLIGLGRQVALIGLRDYRPVPGFDRVLPSLDDARALLQEFRDMHVGEEIRIASTLKQAWPEAEALAFDPMVELADRSTQLKPLGRLVISRRAWCALVGGTLLVGALAWGALHYLDEQRRSAAAERAARENDPNHLYERQLPDLLRRAGVPGNRLLSQWRSVLGELPLQREGWALQRFDCRQATRECVATWVRHYGNFSDFDRHPPLGARASHAAPSTGKGKDKASVLNASITTHHAIATGGPGGPPPMLVRERLPSVQEATTRWGSHLQDLMLVAEPGTTEVSLAQGGLLGPGSVDRLQRPVVSMPWRIADGLWSLPSLDLPDYAVPDTLTVKLDGPQVTYSLTGALYAKAKQP